MILSDSEIKEKIDCGLIKVNPKPTEEQYDTSSLDLRLGSTFFNYTKRFLERLQGVEPPIFDPENLTSQR